MARGDFSRWIRDVIDDTELADRIEAKIEGAGIRANLPKLLSERGSRAAVPSRLLMLLEFERFAIPIGITFAPRY